MAVPVVGAAALLAAAGAVKGVVDEIRRLPDAVRGFVDALSPQSGERLDVAFKSLHATIGQALQPVLTTATGIVQQFASAISSGMDELRGPIEAVTQTFAGVLQPAIAAAGVVFDGLAKAARLLEPLLKPLGTFLEGVVAIGHVLTAVVTEGLVALLEAITPGGKTLASLTEQLTIGFVGLIEGTLRLTDFFLNLIGREKLLIPILQSLSRDRSTGRREGAPSGFGMSGLEEIYRRRLVEAARSGGQDPAVRSADFLGEIKKIAERILAEIAAAPERRERERQAAAGDAALGPILFPFLRWMRMLGGGGGNNPNNPPPR